MSDKENHNDQDHDQEIEIEVDDDIVQEENQQAKIKKLREELKAAKKESKDNLDGWQRARADYINLQQQLEKEKTDIRRRATEGLILDLLPALDIFDMAMMDRKTWESVDEQWRKGIEHIYDQLHRVLVDHGVEPIDSTKEPFDPEIHEPLETVPIDDETQDGVIIQIMQKGYRRDGRVLRPAKVKFYKFSNEE